MLLPIQGQPVIWHAWRDAVATFSLLQVVIACPADDVDAFSAAVPSAQIYGFTGAENDVLGRFHACAHFYRDDPDTVIVRVTPDDWPIDVFRERCTLAQL